MEIKLTKVISGFRKKLLFNIMRTFMFLFCTAVFSFTPNNALSQSSKIKIKSDITLSVDEVFDIIMNQTDYTFVYQEGIFNGLPKIFIKRGTIRTKKLLEKTLAVGNFEYDLNNEIIKLVKTSFTRKAAFQRTITGNVTDKDGLGIPGVNVIVDQRGASTNIDGDYSIRANTGDTISFRYVGYKTQNVVITDQDEINITLLEELAELGEVVVTGYQQIKKERATGSFSKVNRKELDNRISTNILGKISNLVPGLLLQDGNFQLRGVSTFTGDTSPLIVVDGFPLTSNSNRTINPEDVESVTVLKDGAAASIWGVQAANGVIVIVTRSNKSGKSKPRIDFSTFLTVQNHFDAQTRDLASVQSIVDFEYNGYKDGYFAPANDIYDNYSLVEEIYQSEFDGDITANEARTRLNLLGQNDIIDENAKHFLRTLIQKQYNVSISGGGELIDYYFSSYYTDTKSNIINDDSERMNLNFKDYSDYLH